jgi:hypothetical protein
MNVELLKSLTWPDLEKWDAAVGILFERGLEPEICMLSKAANSDH